MSRTDEEITELIFTDDTAFRIFLQGYSKGHQDGQAHMVLSNEQVIELAARRERVLTFLDAEIRETMRSNREFIGVRAARERDAR